MSIRQRVAARLGTVSVIAGTAIAFAAAPAYAAADTDLGVSLSGTTIAATSSGKVFDITITNAGAATATGVEVIFDLGELEQDKVSFVEPTAPNGEDACDDDGDSLICGVEDIPAGQSLDLGARLDRIAGSGPAGEITVRVRHAGNDPNEQNDVDSVAVTVGESGPDLYAFAPDVPFDMHTGEVGGTVAAGQNAMLFYEVGNQGDEAVDGVRATITLPAHVTFGDGPQECTYDAARTRATCTFDGLALIPFDQDDNIGDDLFSAVLIPHAIRIAADAPAGTLTGGVVTVEPIEHAEAPTARRAAATELPAGATPVQPRDVDDSDNSDEFSVHVAAQGGGGGGGEGGGELPITGAKAGLFGGVGLAVLVAGAVLLVIARRRRVVLVAPQDETPTA
jgi:LPXTG-motif cell wall-anchored protein